MGRRGGWCSLQSVLLPIIVLASQGAAADPGATSTARASCPANATTAVGEVLGAGALQHGLAHTIDACCRLCMGNPACVAFTFEKKPKKSICFLKDNQVSPLLHRKLLCTMQHGVHISSLQTACCRMTGRPLG